MASLDPSRAPLFEALAAHAEARHASFHVPGHKSGQAFARLDAGAPERAYYERLLQLDLTELTGLDDLHQPEGAIREAERLAADCFGAARTHFLVGGSTAGNLALVLAVCGRGELLLVERSVHKSVLHGLMLAGAQAVFLPPRIDEATGIAAGVGLADVREALDRYPEARGLIVTNPNYYGMASDLRELAALLHERGIPLLVDEAHGAHFGFHPELPPSALSCGADAVVQSTHKQLTAMTMGAMLHLQGPLVDAAAVARLLAMLQSSSPSYPIMASLDLARREMHTAEGRAHLARALAAAQRARRWLREQPWYGSLAAAADVPAAGTFGGAGGRTGPAPAAGSGASAAPARRAAYDALDPFKVTVWDATGTLNGYALQRELERRGCFAELATPRHALLAFGPASTDADAARLIAALDDIARQHRLPDRPLVGPARPPLPFPAAARVSEPVAFGLTGTAAAAASGPAAAGAPAGGIASGPAATGAPAGGIASGPAAAGASVGGLASGLAATGAPAGGPAPCAAAAVVSTPGSSRASQAVRRVPLHAAAGLRSAAMVIPYPPGIPVLYPGERITPETAAYLQELAEQGARFQGGPDGKLTLIDVTD